MLGKILEHIDAHLDERLTLDDLSTVAATSKFHFHRRFTARFGVSVHRYVQRLRLRRAAFRLAFRTTSIVEIALDSGYESPEAFARAFKKQFGCTPSQFRADPARDAPPPEVSPRGSVSAVSIRDFPSTRVAAIEHRHGPIEPTLRRFVEWRRRYGPSPRTSATFNVLHRDEGMDICATTERPIAENELGVVAKTIAGGRCAVLRYVGRDEGVRDAVHGLREWVAANQYVERDAPPFLQRITFFPDVAEHEAVTDVFVPIV